MNSRIIQTFRIRPFLFLWLAEVVSQIAMNMMNFILLTVAFTLTNSNTAVAGIILSFSVPAVLFGMVAGAYVDRWDKKKVLFITNIIRLILLLFLGFWHDNLLFLYSITFLVAVVTQFFIPAETPMIPVLVKKDLLLSANALFGIGLYGSILLAYALSGPFLIFLGPTYAFLAIAALFFIASLLVMFIDEPNTSSRLKPLSFSNRTIVSEIKLAFKRVLTHREVSQSFFLLTLSQLIIFMIAVIGPGYAKNVLFISIDTFPIVFITPAAIGMGIGAFLLTHYYHNASKQKIGTVGIFLSALGLLLLPYGSSEQARDFMQSLNSYMPAMLHVTVLHSVVLLATLLGFANALIFVPANTVIQEKTAEDERGKVYGTLNTVASLLSLFPVIIAGSLADTYGVNVILLGVGLSIGFIGIMRLVRH